MKDFCFTVDDNIRFLKEIQNSGCKSLFDHPYLAMYRRLHERYGVKVQLNLFYEMPDFDLSMMPDDYRAEWAANTDWLLLSFHSKWENERPYESSDYEEVYRDCRAVHDQIRRFAGEGSLAPTTTIHYCRTTLRGLDALRDNGVQGLLGLYGTPQQPRTSYMVPEDCVPALQCGDHVMHHGIHMGAIDSVLNIYGAVEAMVADLETLLTHEHIHIMIHEQYFYPDYYAYHENFEQKLDAAFALLQRHGYASRFFHEML